MPLYRVRLTGFLIGQTHENVFHMRNKEGFNSFPADLALEIQNQWCTILRDGFPNGQFVWSNINVRDLDQPNLAPTNLPTNIQGLGSTNTSILPFVTTVIRFQTAVAGRKGRGRMYVSTPNSGNIVGGFMSNPTIAFWNQKVQQLSARYLNGGTSNYRLVIKGKAAGSPDIPVTLIAVDTLYRVQRRRNIGVGA